MLNAHVDRHATVDNLGSAARDYLARERNAIQYFKLCLHMMVVAMAFALRLKLATASDSPGQATTLKSLEERFALPLGIVFFVFAILACGNATYEYFHLQSKMNRQIGFVQVNAVSQAFWGLLVGLVAAGTICVLVAQS